MVVGLTVVSIGTSMPELAIGIDAARQGSSGLAVGDIVGTNLVNILLILGLSALIAPIVLEQDAPFRPAGDDPGRRTAVRPRVRRKFSLLLGLSALDVHRSFCLPGGSAHGVVHRALRPGLGRGRAAHQRVPCFLCVPSPVLFLLPSANLGAAFSGLVLSLFLFFTVQSSLCLFGVVD